MGYTIGCQIETKNRNEQINWCKTKQIQTEKIAM